MGMDLSFGNMASVQCGQDRRDNVVKRLRVPVGFGHDLKTAQSVDEISGERPRVVAARDAAFFLPPRDQAME